MVPVYVPSDGDPTRHPPRSLSQKTNSPSKTRHYERDDRAGNQIHIHLFFSVYPYSQRSGQCKTWLAHSSSHRHHRHPQRWGSLSKVYWHLPTPHCCPSFPASYNQSYISPPHPNQHQWQTYMAAICGFPLSIVWRALGSCMNREAICIMSGLFIREARSRPPPRPAGEERGCDCGEGVAEGWLLACACRSEA